MSIRNLPITVRLCILFASGITILLGAFFILSIQYFEKELIREFDRSLDERFAYLSRHLETKVSGQVYFRGSNYPNEVKIKGVDEFAHVEVWNKDGERLFKNSPLAFPKTSENTVVTFESRGSRHRAKIALSENYVIKSAFSLDHLDSRVNQYMWWFLSLLPLATLFAGFLGFLFAKRAMAPIKKITEHAKNINAQNLSQKIKINNSEDELGQLAAVLNNMFSRVNASFESLKRFTSDASHELRTPLTAIRATCEVALGRNLSRKEKSEVLGSVLEEIERMTDLSEALLTLARGDAGLYQLRKKQMELKTTASEVADLLNVLAEEKKQIISVIGKPQDIQGDKTLIRQALMGLVHNAIKYSPAHSEISINISGTTISVSDQGPGIAPKHQTEIFERFYRIEDSRSKETGGAGLGLSIVKWIAEIHDGHVRYEAGSPGSVFTLDLPGN